MQCSTLVAAPSSRGGRTHHLENHRGALHTLIDFPAVWTPVETPWLGTLPAVVSNDAVPDFTDGSYVAQALPRVPIAVWSPGHPTAMHATNERVSISDLELSIQQFSTTVQSWSDET